MPGRFDGRVVIVTGGSSGIGQASAVAFAKEGAKVVVAARRADRSAQTVGQIRELRGEATFVSTDVSSRESVQAMVTSTIATYGRLDCAFNNAGINGDHLVATADHSEANWDAVMSINLKGVWLCMKYEIPEMLRQGGGAIVNNSSIYGLGGSPYGGVPYAVSKHGVIALTKTAALEYARQGIRVNAVCPGFTHSEMVDPAIEAYPAEFEKLLRNDVPMGRIADPLEIASAVLWLCSSEASYVTGQALAPDGGWLAK